jgi:hypothetical protein
MNPDCSSNNMYPKRIGRLINNTTKIQWKIKGIEIFFAQRGM